MPRFLDRHDAGRQLAKRLQRFAGRSDVLVVGLARGGVPVAHEVARAIRAPMETLVVNRLGTPGRGNAVIGAVASGGIRVLDAELIRFLRVTEDAINSATRDAMTDIDQLDRTYRRGRPFPSVQGLTVIIVDDELVTGATMSAAVNTMRSLEPAQIIVAVPVGPADVGARLRCLADDCILAVAPFPYRKGTDWYADDASSLSESREFVWDASMVLPDGGPGTAGYRA